MRSVEDLCNANFGILRPSDHVGPLEMCVGTKTAPFCLKEALPLKNCGILTSSGRAVQEHAQRL